MRHINLIVIHCNATPNGRPVSAKTVDQWHRERGFNEIGYHYLIGVDGLTELGRPLAEPGAHAKGFNAHSISVCMVGGTGGPDRNNPGRYTQAQWDALRFNIQNLMDAYPDAKVVGHRDLSLDLDGDGEVEPHEWIKLCPAFDVPVWLAAGMVPPEGQVLQEANHA